jgi:thiamine biosynthesis lipoprotein
LTKDQNLDFWWIVKGYTVDLVKNYLLSKWFNDFIINAWWDIFLSWTNNWTKWVVWVDNPFKTEENFAILELENMSISTSWSYKRNWEIWKNNYHHILNPLNNSNKNEIISITIITNKTYLSDCYATACFNMWINKSLNFLEENNIDWIIIWNDWQIYHSRGVENLWFRVV